MCINDKLERIYYVKYDKDPFYLIIDDLKGYFKFDCMFLSCHVRVSE